MSTPDLTPTLREALTKAINADKHHNFLSAGEFDALIDLRNDCPEQPALEDGIYEVPEEDDACRLVYVRDGRYGTFRNPDGTFYGSGDPLPDDVSGWRRIDGPPTVTPEQLEAAARAWSGYSESEWFSECELTKKSLRRTRTREGLAAAGIEASDR